MAVVRPLLERTSLQGADVDMCVALFPARRIDAMNGPGSPAGTLFKFGDRMKVEILQGDILAPGVAVEAVVSTDDNYLTMGSGVSRSLAAWAGPEYVSQAQAQCPVSLSPARARSRREAGAARGRHRLRYL
jgi:hypothetical protein